MRDDLVKLKCDYFDSVIKELKDSLEYHSDNDSFLIESDYDCDFQLPDVCIFFIVKDRKKYEPEIFKCIQRDTWIRDGEMFINCRFFKKEIVDLEDGIYYKGFKVSEL